MSLSLPDVEAAVATLLGAGTRLPNPVPTDGFLRVTAQGGQRRNLVQAEPRLVVESWHKSEQDAFDLIRDAWAALAAAANSYVGDVFVTRVDLSLPANLPDRETGLAHYSITATLTVSLQEVTA